MCTATLTPKTFHTIDTGRSRTTADVLHIKGHINTTLVSAALRILYFYDKFGGDMNKGNSHSKSSLSIHDMEDTLKKHPELEKCVNAVNPLMQTKLVVPSVALFTYYLFSQISKKSTAEFFEKLATGYDLSKDHPILTLRNHLLEIKRHKSYNSQTHTTALLILTWNAFLAGHKLSKIEWDRSEAFPTVDKKHKTEAA